MTQLALPSRGVLVKVGVQFPDLLPGAKEKHDAGLGTVMAIFYVGSDAFEPEGFEVLTVANAKLRTSSLPQRVNELISTSPDEWKAKGADPAQLIPQLVEELGQLHPAILAEGCCSIRVPLKVDDATVFCISRLSFVEFLSQIQARVHFAKGAFEVRDDDDDDSDEDDDATSTPEVAPPSGSA